MSWAAVDRCDPVGGNAGEFARVGRQWRTAADVSSRLSLTFRGIVADTSTIGFEGLAADAFQQIVADSADVLKDVPQVCADVAYVMEQHAAALRRLRAEADAALARAKAAWNDKVANQRSADAANGRVSRIRQQIRSLQCYPPEQVASQIQRLDYNLGVERSNAQIYESRAEAAAQRLHVEYLNRNRYEQAEEGLDAATAQVLRSLDLRSLEDPNALERLVQAGAAFLRDPGKFWGELVDAALIAIRDGLKVLLDIVAFVGLALFVVSLFVPGLNVIMLGVAFVGLGLALGRFGITYALTQRGTTNPETGEAFGRSELLSDGVDVAMATLGVVGALGAVHTLPKSGAFKPLFDLTKFGRLGTAAEGLIPTALGTTGTIVTEAVQGDFELTDISEIRGADLLLQAASPAYSVLRHQRLTVLSADRRASRPVSCHLMAAPAGAR